ncbi:hypothetical protein K1X76_06555 [bacterium]|nr:hypothetical protein [bacterium]
MKNFIHSLIMATFIFGMSNQSMAGSQNETPKMIKTQGFRTTVPAINGAELSLYTNNKKVSCECAYAIERTFECVVDGSKFNDFNNTFGSDVISGNQNESFNSAAEGGFSSVTLEYKKDATWFAVPWAGPFLYEYGPQKLEHFTIAGSCSDIGLRVDNQATGSTCESCHTSCVANSPDKKAYQNAMQDCIARYTQFCNAGTIKINTEFQDKVNSCSEE